MKLVNIQKRITVEFLEDEVNELVKFIRDIELSRLMNVQPKIHAIASTLSALLEKPYEKKDEKKI